MSHHGAYLLLVAQSLGVEFHRVAGVAHLQHEVALVAQRVDQVGQGHAHLLRVFVGQHGGVELGGGLVVGKHVHLLDARLEDGGRGLDGIDQHGREARIVAFHQALKELLALGELLHGAGVVVGHVVHIGQVVEQRGHDGQKVLAALGRDVDQHVEGILGAAQGQHVVVAVDEERHAGQPQPGMVQQREAGDAVVEDHGIDGHSGIVLPLVLHQVLHVPQAQVDGCRRVEVLQGGQLASFPDLGRESREVGFERGEGFFNQQLFHRAI